MRCNYCRKSKSTEYRKDLMFTIHKKMSYEELLENAIGLGSYYVPKLPEKVQHLIVRTQTEYGLITFFLDTSPIKSLGYGDKVAIAPITIDLLELYGVTREQFINDYFSKNTIIGING